MRTKIRTATVTAVSRASLIAYLLTLCSAAFGGDIQGLVRNSQGEPVAGATVTAIGTGNGEQKSEAWPKAVTARDGSYKIETLAPGAYNLTVSIGANQPVLRRAISLAEASSRVRADFQLPAPTAQLSGADERNQNIFINRIDWNDLRNRIMGQRGPDPQYLPEFKADQNYFGAQFGAPLLTFEGIRPRPETSRWHGALSALHQNSVWNARNFFNAGRLLPSRSTSYDLTAEGPVVAERLSVLFDFSQTLTSGFVNGNVQAPLADERTALAANPQVNSIIASLLKAYPAELPNLPYVSKRQLNSNAERDANGKDGLARADWRLGSTTSVASRYFVNQYGETPFQIILGQFPQTDLRYQGLYTNVTRNFSQSAVGRFGAHYDRSRAVLEPTRQYSALFASLGLTTVPDVNFGGNLSGLGPGKQFPRYRVQNRFQYYADVAQTAGRHSFLFGWSLARVQLNDLQSDNTRGTLGFSPNFGNDEIANFRLGRPTSFTFTLGNLYRGFRNWEHSFYAGDQLRVSPTLTVSLGVRYELMTAPSEVNGLTDVRFRVDKNNIAPRAGFAWNPGKGRTTIRGAYGISYSTIFPISYGMTRFNPPAVQVIQLQAPDLTNLVTLLRNTSPSAGGRTALSILSPALAFPYAHQYSFGIERALPGAAQLRLAYIGERGYHMLTLGIHNRPAAVLGIAATTANANDRRPDPRYFDINTIESNGISYFDAAQVSVNKRLSKGLTFRVAYTFSKNIDFNGDFTTTASGTESPPDIGTPTCENCNQISDQKGPSMFDTPHAFGASYSYNLPFPGASNRVASALLKGWQISGNTIFQSGGPFHLHTGSDGPGFGNIDGTTQDRPNVTNPSLLHQHFNNPDTTPLRMGADTCQTPTAAIPYLHCKNFDANIPVGGRGNLAMGTFRKAGTNNWNLAIGRTFRMPGGERSLQFRAELYNLFNFAQFSMPGIQLASETFGKITNTSNRGRQIQFSLKLNF